MTEYFSHDYHARSDPKIIKLRMKYGFEGVGLYWSIIEILYESNGRVMRTECERIAYELRIEIERIAEIIDTDLFQKDDKYFWSDSVLKRLNIREEKSEKARDSANKRWGNKDLTTHANALPAQSERNAIKEKKSKVNIKENESKLNESKEKEIKEKVKEIKHIYGEYQNVYLTDTELQKLKDRFNDWEIKIKEMDSGIELKGYKYKNHYLAILKWAEKDNHKTDTKLSKVGNHNLQVMKNLLEKENQNGQ